MTIFTLLILFQIKHFICDFPLQNRYMLGKFKDYPDYIMPLLSHSAVQGFGTLLIIALHAPIFWPLAILDLVTHFFIDRIKADRKLLGRWKPDQSMFWNALGIDQLLHNLIYILIVMVIV
jgi:hypothetical protein